MADEEEPQEERPNQIEDDRDEHRFNEVFAVPLNNDLERRIAEAFEVFDHGGSKTVDVREVGTILRSLGCCPTESEIQEILVKVEDIETSSVHLARFLPLVTQIITENKLQPASPEDLLKAFHTLDREGKGYINKDYLSTLIMEEGEPFTQEELDEMMAVAVDTETGNIPYEYYINQIMVPPYPEFDVYALIPPPEAKAELGDVLNLVTTEDNDG